jgi:hypothetical protein
VWYEEEERVIRYLSSIVESMGHILIMCLVSTNGRQQQISGKMRSEQLVPQLISTMHTISNYISHAHFLKI